MASGEGLPGLQANGGPHYRLQPDLRLPQAISRPPSTHAHSLPPPSKPCSDLIVHDVGGSEDSNAAQGNTGPHCCPGGSCMQRRFSHVLYGGKMGQGDLSDPRLTPQDGENEGTVGLRVPG